MTLVFTLVCLFFVGISLYLAGLTLAAFRFRKRTDPHAPPLKLAVVIPAHNEALQIRSTLETVGRTRYPEDCYEVFVIADNCEDETAAASREAGARVLVRTDPTRRGKGQALDWFLRQKEDAWADRDGIVIMDADTEMDESFLPEVSASLSHPEVPVVQGYYGVSNPAESALTALTTAALMVFHHVRPAGRNRLGGSAGLKGNGMAFRTEVLRKYGWPSYSVVEDLEFGARLLVDGILVHYNPDAVVRAEMAVTGKQAESQRRRWEGGRIRIFRRWTLPLLGMWVRRRQFRYFDGFMDLLIPPLSALVLALVLLLVAARWWVPAMMPALVLAVGGVFFYVLSGLVLRKAPLTVWLYLAASPFFVLWKVLLYAGMLKGKGANEWVRTRRKAEMGKESGKK